MVRAGEPRRPSATDALNAPEVVPSNMDFDAPAPSDDRLPAGTRIGRAALRVADLDETTAFYRDVVGLAVLDRDDEAIEQLRMLLERA